MKNANFMWTSLALALLFSSFSFAGTQPTSDEATIREMWKEYEVAYNSGDSEALALLWDTEGDLFSLSGGIFRGRVEIGTFFAKALSKNYKGSRFQLTIDQIRFIEHNVAVVDGAWDITGETLPQGYPSSGIYTQVLVRTKGDWRIAVARPSVPLRGHTRRHGRKAPAGDSK